MKGNAIKIKKIFGLVLIDNRSIDDKTNEDK